MIAIEISDVVFAVDSIPAVFGVTEVRVLANVSLRTKRYDHTIHSPPMRRTRSLFRLTCLL
jgi:hypothetical protein